MSRALAIIITALLIYVSVIVAVVISTDEYVSRELGTGDVLKLEVVGKTGPQGPPGPGGGGRGINVRAYGAVGDGKADDTEAFQKAIQAAKAGDILYIPRGNYLVKEELYIDHGIHLLGDGPKSQVYQSEDKNLFHYKMYTPGYYGAAGCIIQSVALGSAAKSEGRSVLLLDESPYNTLYNVSLGGGYYGLHIRGSLGTTSYSLRNITYRGGAVKDGELLGFFAPLPDTWAVVYAEPTSQFAINHTSFFGTTIQQRAEYGFHLTAGGSQGGITMHGGLIEGVKQHAVYLRGFNLSSSISGMHFESGAISTGNASNVKLAGCANVNIEGCFLGGNRGLEISACKGIEVRGGSAWNIVADELSTMIDVHGLLYKDLDIHSGQTRCWNLRDMDDQGSGGYGYYSGPITGIINQNTDLEKWENELPVGFGKYGAITRETGITHTGKSAVRIDYKPNIAGLVYSVDAGRYKGKPHSISVRFWVWIPHDSPVKPRMYFIYDNWKYVGISPVFDKVEYEKWTPVNYTQNLSGNAYKIEIVMGAIYVGKAEGYIIADDFYVAEFPF
jgi:hypothetical protein